MEEIEQTNKVKILEELQKNGRASLSEIAKKTGLSRQTVAKTINNLEKKKEIWGYSAIFDPKLIGKKQFIFLAKADFSINPEDILKKLKSPRESKYKQDLKKFEFKSTLLLHGTSDMLVSILAKDVIEAKKLMNDFKKIYGANIRDIELVDVIATFRDNGIENPKMIDEWANLLI